ncbi:hypothetical protein ACSBPU_12980 [Parapusillimonas sp. JC17]|uniref:hypothetical protein n=1 Tax=Parapusillimonas sp. JC17 TaxID=3445768 RepID=UPI003F9F2B2C
MSRMHYLFSYLWALVLSANVGTIYGIGNGLIAFSALTFTITLVDAILFARATGTQP